MRREREVSGGQDKSYFKMVVGGDQNRWTLAHHRRPVPIVRPDHQLQPPRRGSWPVTSVHGKCQDAVNNRPSPRRQSSIHKAQATIITS